MSESVRCHGITDGPISDGVTDSEGGGGKLIRVGVDMVRYTVRQESDSLVVWTAVETEAETEAETSLVER